MKSSVYSETSKLFQPAFLISFIPVMLVMIMLFFDQKAHRDIWGMLFIALGLLTSGTVLFVMLLLKLSVEIDEKGVRFKYFPYVRKFRHYDWDSIRSTSLITFNPIVDFGGWGPKKSKKYGQAYTTKGNKGLWITLKDGSSLVLSIFNVDQVKACMSDHLQQEAPNKTSRT